MQRSINTNGFKPICLSVLRPLGSTGKYYLDISIDDLKKNNKGELTNVNKKTKIIAYTKACKSRIKYSGIDISKVCDKHNNSTVGFKDEINYTITIKNNGTKGYKGLVVKEYIDSSLVECNMKNQQIKNGKIELTWKNINISAGSTKKISFKVKVKNNLQNLNKKIVSEGNVNNIATTKIINNIDYTLSKDKQNRLINEANSINYDKYTNGKEMISDIYKNALGIDIDLKKGEDSFLKVSDIIKTNESKDVEIINNNVKKMVLNDFYGTWTASKKVCIKNNSILHNFLGIFAQKIFH